MKNSLPPVALVTGASRRIGAVIASFLHSHQFNVIVHYHHNKAAAENLCKALCAKRSQSAISVPADLNALSEIKKLVATSYSAWNRMDLLVNNASSYFPTPFGQSTEQQWHDLINTNLKGPYFLCEQAAPHLKATQGNIINITDIHGKIPLKNYPIYSISKAGLTMMTLALAKELAPDIRANAIAPGPTLWPEHENEISAQRKTELLERTLLKKLSDAQDIAQAVLFLTQQHSMTGQIINIDCGRLLQI